MKISKTVSWDHTILNKIVDYMIDNGCKNFSEAVNDYIEHLEYLLDEQKEAIERLTKTITPKGIKTPKKTIEQL